MFSASIFTPKLTGQLPPHTHSQKTKQNNTHTQIMATITTDVNTSRIEEQLFTPFGLTVKEVAQLMRDTNAVLAGGAVTHYLANTGEALPPKSDLDFWVFDPDLTSHVDEDASQLFHSRAFRHLVEERFAKTLNPHEFVETPRPANVASYIDAKKDFLTSGNTKISVRWFINPTRNQYSTINLIFTSRTAWNTVKRFDVPLCRAMIYSTSRAYVLKCEYDPVVLRDLEDKLLTPPEKPFSGENTENRVIKYCNRYNLTIRPDSVPPVPDSSPDSAPVPASC